MKKYRISRAEYYVDSKGKRWVIYFSAVEGDLYCSIHDSTGLTDEQAKGVFDKKDGWKHGKFRREHYRQVSQEHQKAMVAKSREKKPSVILN